MSQKYELITILCFDKSLFNFENHFKQNRKSNEENHTLRDKKIENHH